MVMQHRRHQSPPSGRPFNPFASGGSGPRMTYSDHRYKGVGHHAHHRRGGWFSPLAVLVLVGIVLYASYSFSYSAAPVSTLTDMNKVKQKPIISTVPLKPLDTASNKQSIEEEKPASASADGRRGEPPQEETEEEEVESHHKPPSLPEDSQEEEEDEKEERGGPESVADSIEKAVSEEESAPDDSEEEKEEDEPDSDEEKTQDQPQPLQVPESSNDDEDQTAEDQAESDLTAEKESEKEDETEPTADSKEDEKEDENEPTADSKEDGSKKEVTADIKEESQKSTDSESGLPPPVNEEDKAHVPLGVEPELVLPGQSTKDEIPPVVAGDKNSTTSAVNQTSVDSKSNTTLDEKTLQNVTLANDTDSKTATIVSTDNSTATELRNETLSNRTNAGNNTLVDDSKVTSHGNQTAVKTAGNETASMDFNSTGSLSNSSSPVARGASNATSVGNVTKTAGMAGGKNRTSLRHNRFNSTGTGKSGTSKDTPASGNVTTALASNATLSKNSTIKLSSVAEARNASIALKRMAVNETSHSGVRNKTMPNTATTSNTTLANSTNSSSVVHGNTTAKTNLRGANKPVVIDTHSNVTLKTNSSTATNKRHRRLLKRFHQRRY